MAENFVLVVFFQAPDGVQQIKLIEQMNFGGKLSVLLERMPAILRDAFKMTPRSNLKLRAIWLGETQWSALPEQVIDHQFEDCLLVMVDEQLASIGAEACSMVGELSAQSAGLHPRRRAAAVTANPARIADQKLQEILQTELARGIYHAESVQDAVRMAEGFKRDGRYDWFRGQRCDWPVTTSISRLSPTEREKAMDRLIRFEMWVKETPELAEIAHDINSILAVAQHYHLPTNMVDFTTEPAIAGQLAVIGEGEREPTSCIVCLDTHDLHEFWQDLMRIPEERKLYPIDPKLLTIDVRNLWRLQTQHGVFLSIPYAEFEKIYRFDRILFPSTTVPPLPLESIYPKRKSSLERLLDGWFMNEELIKAEEFKKQFRTEPPLRFDPPLVESGFFSRPLEPHPSWSNTAGWSDALNSERYQSVLTQQTVDIDVPLMADLADERDRIHGIALDFLKRNASSRKSLVQWRFRSGTGPAIAERCTRGALDLWDGMRSLPYTDQQIASAIANHSILCIIYEEARAQDRHSADIQTVSTALDDPIEVEFSSRDGSYSRGYVSMQGMLAATRSDLADHLRPQHHERLLNSARDLLLAVRAPDLLFDFPRLVQLFATQVLPTQALFRLRNEVASLCYSPAQLRVFGLP